tara:strand:- start:7 stop:324 length:318 start_codon:yes stop_codon:yes gene_type:complete
MKQTINQYQFADAFKSAGRQDQFSYAGLNALFDELEAITENVTGEEYELDVIELCCEYSEHKSALDAAADYSFDVDGESEESALDYLRDNTTVIEFDGGIIIQQF